MCYWYLIPSPLPTSRIPVSLRLHDVVALRRIRRYPHQNLVWLSTLMITHTHTHTPRRYAKIYYLHNQAFWGEQGRLLKGVRKQLERVGAFILVSGWGCHGHSCMWMGRNSVFFFFLISHRCVRRHTWVFLTTSQMWGIRQKGRVRLKSSEQPNIKGQTLYHLRKLQHLLLETPVCPMLDTPMAWTFLFPFSAWTNLSPRRERK